MKLFFLDVGVESTGNIFLILDLGMLLGSYGLSRAVDNLAIFDESLDQPMILEITQNTLFNTGLAEIKISIITDAAVPVSIRYTRITVVAADSECYSRSSESLVCATECDWMISRHALNLSVEMLASAKEPGYWCFVITFFQRFLFDCFRGLFSLERSGMNL